MNSYNHMHSRPSRFRRGFTLADLLIVIGFLFVIGAIGVGIFAKGIGAGTVRENAETQAREYISTMHPTWQTPRVTCQGYDTDNNGYVRCTIVASAPVPNANPPATRDVTDNVECAAYWWISWNKGCQAPRWVSPGTRDPD